MSCDITKRLRVLSAALLEGEFVSLPAVFTQCADEIIELRQQAVLLRAERDEARREFCKCNSSYPHDMRESHEIAESRGWDCFKNETTVTDSRSANSALDKLSQLDEEIGL